MEAQIIGGFARLRSGPLPNKTESTDTPPPAAAAE
jgi:hypothetical protein